jgi:uncharacterized membrane protein (UPF0127 family)
VESPLVAFGEERCPWVFLLPSIGFMASQGRLVDTQEMKLLDDELAADYTPAESARYALEVNRGFFDERGVEVGDRAELPKK